MLISSHVNHLLMEIGVLQSRYFRCDVSINLYSQFLFIPPHTPTQAQHIHVVSLLNTLKFARVSVHVHVSCSIVSVNTLICTLYQCVYMAANPQLLRATWCLFMLPVQCNGRLLTSSMNTLMSFTLSVHVHIRLVIITSVNTLICTLYQCIQITYSLCEHFDVCSREQCM